MRNDVIVIVGSGGMGAAIAHRLGSGRTVVLSDVNPRNLDAATRALSEHGHDVHARTVDVTSPRSVTDLAEYAAAFGPITNLVHTAGVSPEQADVDTILRVDLLGVALVLEGKFSAAIRRLCSLSWACTESVSTTPGRTPLTRIPSGPSSLAAQKRGGEFDVVESSVDDRLPDAARVFM
jgi:NAD(P)-dependent dehydrogenase (short-subunit alcohol dehydrogenase family)